MSEEGVGDSPTEVVAAADDEPVASDHAPQQAAADSDNVDGELSSADHVPLVVPTESPSPALPPAVQSEQSPPPPFDPSLPFGAQNGPRIDNFDTILKEVDDMLTGRPPAIEYLFVCPFRDKGERFGNCFANSTLQKFSELASGRRMGTRRCGTRTR
jgi:hypothetical protein